MGNITNSLSFARSYTKVEEALVVDSPDEVQWKEAADFVVVGYGGAGVAAANQAVDSGLSVIALERFEGGGATALNGGVVYFGGGTSVQKAAGFEDTPEAMYEYLSREVGGVISEPTLRRFCESGPEMIEWLEAHGVRFNPSAYTKKTSYPAAKYYLYFSDNALLERYRGKHPPAPRGHKVDMFLGENASFGFGRGIVEPQQKSAAAAGVRVFTQSDVRQMVVDRSGTVLGVKSFYVSPEHPRHKALVKAQSSMQKWQLMLPQVMPGSQITLAIAKYYSRVAAKIEQEAATTLYIRAKRGVCLSSGGFIFNEAMRHDLASGYETVMPLGTPGDDGSGILLGYSAGAMLNRMDEISSWRFLNPPAAWGKGPVVNAKGERFADEASYGATIGQAMMKRGNDGVGWLILDQELWDLTKDNFKHDGLMTFQVYPAQMTMMFKSKKAGTVRALAEKISVNPDNFERTVEDYRKAQKGEITDKFSKARKDMGALTNPPYYALDVGADSSFFPLPSITLGGLVADENTGLALREDGATVPGLYAAGRTAVGLCSNLYLSGLSSSDCIFSGRRAAAHAASLNGDEPAPSHQGFAAAASSRKFVPPR